MSRIWITSDLHFNHDKEFLYKPRGFNSAETMMGYIMDRWNELVDENDDVYVLGDLMMNDDDITYTHLRKLKGRIHIVLGNHDTDRRIGLYRELPNVVEIEMAMRLRYKKFHFYLSHYPTLTSNYDDDKPLYARVINLCGHSHTKDPFADWEKGTIYHCELDAHNNEPVLIDDIIEDLKQKFRETKICNTAENML